VIDQEGEDKRINHWVNKMETLRRYSCTNWKQVMDLNQWKLKTQESFY